MTRINVWDYADEYLTEREEILAAVDRVFKSGRLILGESVAAFEREFAAYSDARFGVGVDNGTNAIVLGLKALNIGAGDEVITVSNTAAPTVLAITLAGAMPRFVDIDADSFLMNVGQLSQAIGPRTRCIVPVHLFGQCVDMEAVTEVAHAHKIHVLEDCAQAHGASRHGRRAGSLAEAAAFSFYPTKVLGAYGDGGMVLTSDEEIRERLKRLRYYGMGQTYYVLGPGYNSRLDEVQAEILRRKLARLDSYIDRRRELAARYRAALSDTSLLLPQELSGNLHVYYVYVVRHPRRDEIMAKLRDYDIHVNISYPWPVHSMSGFSHLGYREGDLPQTERAAREIFSLPMYPSLTNARQDRVCDVLRDILRQL